MSEANNSSIIFDLIKIIFGALFGYAVSVLKNHYKKEERGHCVFNVPYDYKSPERREVIIKKRWNKIKHIDCPWFAINQIKGYENFTFPQCIYGDDKIKIENKDVGICRFYRKI